MSLILILAREEFRRNENQERIEEVGELDDEMAYRISLGCHAVPTSRSRPSPRRDFILLTVTFEPTSLKSPKFGTSCPGTIVVEVQRTSTTFLRRSGIPWHGTCTMASSTDAAVSVRPTRHAEDKHTLARRIGRRSSSSRGRKCVLGPEDGWTKLWMTLTGEMLHCASSTFFCLVLLGVDLISSAFFAHRSFLPVLAYDERLATGAKPRKLVITSPSPILRTCHPSLPTHLGSTSNSTDACRSTS